MEKDDQRQNWPWTGDIQQQNNVSKIVNINSDQNETHQAVVAAGVQRASPLPGPGAPPHRGGKWWVGDDGTICKLNWQSSHGPVSHPWECPIPM